MKRLMVAGCLGLAALTGVYDGVNAMNQASELTKNPVQRKGICLRSIISSNSLGPLKRYIDECGGDINERSGGDCTLLMTALLWDGDIDLIKWILDHKGVNLLAVNWCGAGIFDMLCKGEEGPLKEVLRERVLKELENKPKNTEEANRQLLLAIMIRDQDKISELWPLIDLNVKDEFGRNPIALFAAQNNVKMVDMAIKKGFEVNNQDNAKETALLLAVANKNLEMVQLLIEAGANPNIVSKYGRSAVHEAVRNRDLGIFKALTQSSKYAIDLGVKNSKRLTLLEVAESKYQKASEELNNWDEFSDGTLRNPKEYEERKLDAENSLQILKNIEAMESLNQTLEKARKDLKRYKESC